MPIPSSTIPELSSNAITSTSDHKEVDDAAVQEAVEQVAKAATLHRQDVIRVAHVMNHDISHGEPVSKMYFSFGFVTFILFLIETRLVNIKDLGYLTQKVLKYSYQISLLTPR